MRARSSRKVWSSRRARAGGAARCPRPARCRWSTPPDRGPRNDSIHAARAALSIASSALRSASGTQPRRAVVEERALGLGQQRVIAVVGGAELERHRDGERQGEREEDARADSDARHAVRQSTSNRSATKSAPRRRELRARRRPDQRTSSVSGRRLQLVEHPVDDDAGDRDVEPDRQRHARDRLVPIEARRAAPRVSVIAARNGTAAASTVWVSRIER